MPHTPEPWKIIVSPRHAYGDRLVITPDDDENRIAVISLQGAPKGDWATAADNAERIRAAVNCCRHLSTDWLLAHVLSLDSMGLAYTKVKSCSAQPAESTPPTRPF
jgi:hypothetical protein